MPTLTTSIEHSTESPSQSNQARKKKGIQIRKEEVKFVDDMMLYRENTLDYTHKKTLLELINEVSNSVKLQDTKSTYEGQLCSYTLKMSYLKKKLRKQSYLQFH